MKRICLITPNLLPVPNVLGGAIETIVTNIVKEQEKEKKIVLTVVSIYNKDAKLESKKYLHTNFIYIKKDLKYLFYGFIFKTVNFIFKKDLNTYNHIVLKKIKKMKFDYVFAEGGNYNSFNEYLKHFSKDQMVLHLHHTGTSNEIIDNTFSKIVGVSDYVLRKFKSTSKINEYYLLKNCIDISCFDNILLKSDKEQLYKKYSLSSKDFIIMYCGRLIKEKGVFELINAFNNIHINNIKLLIIGSVNFGLGGEDNYTSLLNQVAKDNSNIIFTGYINPNELYKYYQLSNVVIIPSRWEEAAGLVCIEAMASKKVIITTGSGGIKEYVNDYSKIVSNDDDKIVDEITNAINDLYKNRHNLNKIGKINYQEAQKYSTKNYYNNFVQLIEEDMDNEKK